MAFEKITIQNRNVETRLKAFDNNKDIDVKEMKDVKEFLRLSELGRINLGKKISQSRLLKYLDILRIPFVYFKKDTAKITLKEMEQFDTDLSKDKIRNKQTGKPLSQNSKVDVRKLFKIYLKWKLRRLMFSLVALMVLAIFLVQGAEAYRAPHGTELSFDLHRGFSAQDYRYVDSFRGPVFRIYGSSGNYRYGRSRDDNRCRYFDFKDLERRTDHVCKWVNQGDFRERVLRARAVDFVVDSTTRRYVSNAGKPSGKAFNYNFDLNREGFRNKEAYHPLKHGVNPRNNYYYEPQRTRQGSWNWRY